MGGVRRDGKYAELKLSRKLRAQLEESKTDLRAKCFTDDLMVALSKPKLPQFPLIHVDILKLISLEPVL